MKHKKIWIGTGIGLLVCGLVTASILQAQPGEKPFKTVTLEEKEFNESVLTSGHLESEEQQNVYMQPGGGEVERIFVKPGEKVKKGAPLVKFKSSGEVDIDQVKLEVERARVNLNQLNDQLREMQKGGSPAASPPAQNAEAGDGNPPPSSEKELRNQIHLANLEYKQAQEKLNQAQSQLADLTVRSEQVGTVIRVNSSQKTEEGAGPLITVANLKELKVSAEISEYDALKIKEDQRATVRSDALPDKEWSAQVTDVGLLPKEGKAGEGSQQVMYPVEISLNEKAPLKLGSRLMAEIILSAEKAPSLPSKAVIKGGKKDHVFVVKGKKAYKQSVKTGKSGNGHIEIVSGLKPGVKVIANPSADLKNGTEVTVQ
ncbi:efflux RND transporter periplasmic adaptor subunit [Salinithrix halophila]|uniref:Efflux RND transporter periplasmic adaptor subunit n=1 Tax=Salinithrix halophila TaxID=1485204 RepID=A0ABV8JG41_9BACL